MSSLLHQDTGFQHFVDVSDGEKMILHSNVSQMNYVIQHHKLDELYSETVTRGLDDITFARLKDLYGLSCSIATEANLADVEKLLQIHPMTMSNVILFNIEQLKQVIQKAEIEITTLDRHLSNILILLSDLKQAKCNDDEFNKKLFLFDLTTRHLQKFTIPEFKQRLQTANTCVKDYESGFYTDSFARHQLAIFFSELCVSAVNAESASWVEFQDDQTEMIEKAKELRLALPADISKLGMRKKTICRLPANWNGTFCLVPN